MLHVPNIVVQEPEIMKRVVCNIYVFVIYHPYFVFKDFVIMSSTINYHIESGGHNQQSGQSADSQNLQHVKRTLKEKLIIQTTIRPSAVLSGIF